MPCFLGELAPRGIGERLVGIGLALGDRPVPLIATLEERASRMRQQDFQAGTDPPVEQDPRADPHGSDSRQLRLTSRVGGGGSDRRAPPRSGRTGAATGAMANRRAATCAPAGRRPRPGRGSASDGRRSPPAGRSRAAPPADLDDHERGRRARVDRHEVDLMTADMDVPSQDRPARLEQPRGDQAFGTVAGLLRRATGRLGLPIHAGDAGTAALTRPVSARLRGDRPALIPRPSRAQPGRRHRTPHRRP